MCLHPSVYSMKILPYILDSYGNKKKIIKITSIKRKKKNQTCEGFQLESFEPLSSSCCISLSVLGELAKPCTLIVVQPSVVKTYMWVWHQSINYISRKGFELASIMNQLSYRRECTQESYTCKHYHNNVVDPIDVG